jgi:hypothetical protein
MAVMIFLIEPSLLDHGSQIRGGPRMTTCSAIASCSDIGGNPEILGREALSVSHDIP